jgi:gamma-glutamyltranspeptidase/glutathione hydrolase
MNEGRVARATYGEVVTSPPVPFTSVRAPHRMVASADGLATQAGLTTLARGGNAVDAAIATNAAIAVTAPQLCGLGGDLFALVHVPGDEPTALNASGRAGSGADPDALRGEGRVEMPFRHDIRTVTVPGCVDGWDALHQRFGRLPLADVLAPAVALAADGFPASPLLVGSVNLVDDRAREQLGEVASQATRPGARVRRPGVARALREIADGGRAAFYGGTFGEGLLALAADYLTPDDLARHQADWAEPLALDAWDHRLWTIPPNSQGYLALAGAWIADGLPLPDDPDDPAWAHLLIEAAVAAGFDRPDVLHGAADGTALLSPARLGPRRDAITPGAITYAHRPLATAGGDTTYLCTVDDDRMAVSLIQSNASGFGSWLVEPSTGINLHNRGLGFSLVPGHPAEYGPGRRPPHTLSPLLVTDDRRGLRATVGSMGGDGQPQILLQVLARLLHNRQRPATTVASGRWILTGAGTGFDTWTSGDGPRVLVEGHAPEGWDAGLAERGHHVTRTMPFDSTYGHAHTIAVEPDGSLAAAADPRTRIGSAAGG